MSRDIFQKSIKWTVILILVGVINGFSNVHSVALAAHPDDLITESKDIAAKIKAPQIGIAMIHGRVTFKVSTLNADDTFTGIIKFGITDLDRQELAQRLNLPLAAVPEWVEIQNVVAEFENRVECPELHLEFKKVEFDIVSIELVIEKFKLNLKETDKDVSQLVCRYIKYLFIGRGHPTARFRPRINELLKPQ